MEGEPGEFFSAEKQWFSKAMVKRYVQVKSFDAKLGEVMKVSIHLCF